MKNKLKWIAGVMLFMALCVFAVRQDVRADENSGKCGKNATWELNDGTLTISGSGAMYDYTDSVAPWMGPDVQKVIIKKGITSIGECAFERCRNLTKVEIPEGVKSIGNSAFHYCNKMTAITIPSGTKSVGNNAFDGCKKLKNIAIPSSLTEVGGFAFNETPWLSNKQDANPLVIVNDILINGQACKGKVSIPDTVKAISIGAFYGCTRLINITIPSSVKSIGDKAFYWCRSLTDITIPSTVSKIGKGAFDECDELKVISCVKNSAADKYAKSNNIKVKYVKEPRTIELLKKSIVVGKSEAVTVNGTGKVTYTSSDNSVATVSSKGMVTAKKIGTVKITVKAGGDSTYAASTKTITVKVVPNKPSNFRTSGIASGIELRWEKASGVTGYEIQYSAKSSFSDAIKITVKKASTTAKKITKLNTKKRYNVRIRSYKTVDGKNYYSAWTDKRPVTTK